MKSNSRARTLLLIGMLPSGCTSTPPPGTPAEELRGEQAVHCLLPAQVRKLGNTMYPARRRLVFESESRCSLRGGEYTVYDRASAAGAAEFYQALAEAGDAEAQYSLGLVYESLYTPARYVEAAQWYQQAAAQQHAGAQKNLSFLYEQGLGVPQDAVMAINLLRQSGGISDDLVMASQMDEALSVAAAEVQALSEALEAQNAETSALQRQLAAVSGTLDSERRSLATATSALAALKAQRAQLLGPGSSETDVAELQSQIAMKERSLASQQRRIDSLAADLSAQQAQLKASERKAALREDALQEELAAVRQRVADTAGDSAAALAARDAQIRALSRALAVSQKQAADQAAGRRSLLAELELVQRELGRSDASDQLAESLAALKEKERMIAEQRRSIEALRQTVAEDQGAATEVRTLRDKVVALQQALMEQEVGYTALELKLEAVRSSAAGQSAADDSRLQTLLAELDKGARALREQQQRMAALEAQVAEAGQVTAALTAGNARLAEERALVQGQLVAAETELARVQAQLVRLESELSQSRSQQNVLLGDKDRLQRALAVASASEDARISDLEAQLAENQRSLQAQAETISRLERSIADRRRDFVRAADDRSELVVTRSMPQPVFPMVPDIDLGGGKRYALIIGNDSYEHLNDLTTAVNGATAIDEILRQRYDFETQLLLNASRDDLVKAFYLLRQKLEAEDQVFIYYAGHGERSAKDPDITYWLPVNAQENELSYAADGIKSTWITNEMRAMKARHVMIVADSCYAGAMVRPVRVAVSSRSIDERRLKWMTRRRSRTVLTSGGNRPVLDESVDGTHSVFTQALVDVLTENPGVIYGEALHAALVQLVRYNARQFNFDQVPRFSEVADADHGNGQFVMKNIRG
ncbi:MAG: caspase family protein [Pseudomonadota bacterium]